MRDAPLAALARHIMIISDDAALTQTLAVIVETAKARPVRVAFVNAHAVNLCYSDEGFLNNLLACDYIFRDGSGMKLLYRFLKRDAGLNLNGTDLIPHLLGLYHGQSVALLGTQQPFLANAAAKISTLGVTPILIIDGFQPDSIYAPAISTAALAITILAMGMPKQERIAALLAQGGIPGLIVCGGAILDFLGGKVTRAPVLFRRAGMEWLYRLALEPRRMFRRYLIGNLVFVFRALRFAKFGNLKP